MTRRSKRFARRGDGETARRSPPSRRLGYWLAERSVVGESPHSAEGNLALPSITAQEWELLSFFEVEPELTDSDVPWVYNDALCCVQRDDFAISVAIAPAYKDVRIIFSHREVKLYELNAMNVKDLRYEAEGGIELLEIEINEVDSLTLRLKPQIELTHTACQHP
jgi:hypothetical protein